MKMALIADTYPPLRTSGAIQMRDLAMELSSQGHAVTVIVPSQSCAESWNLESTDSVRVLRLKIPSTKDLGYLKRTINESRMPFIMRSRLNKSPLRAERWDAAIWYSPSIFLGPVAKFIKSKGRCKGYLILRDIFPKWAVDMGLLRKGLAYGYFKLVERYQYSVADIIGVQSASNLDYLAAWSGRQGRRVEILNNWLAESPLSGCRIVMSKTRLAGRKVFVYTGNMGVAQGAEFLVDLATRFKTRTDVGFLFVGRGSAVLHLKELVETRGLDNTLFHEEIDPHEIPGLLSQCYVGMIALDPRHKTHNFPGKFLAYMQAGIPVLARLNAGNDLTTLINESGVGLAYVGNEIEELRAYAARLCDDPVMHDVMAEKARELSRRKFSAAIAASQIHAALTQPT